MQLAICCGFEVDLGGSESGGNVVGTSRCCGGQQLSVEKVAIKKGVPNIVMTQKSDYPVSSQIWNGRSFRRLPRYLQYIYLQRCFNIIPGGAGFLPSKVSQLPTI